ncbi:uncharacterized protein LOC126263589 [Schistocerca nitens]|uniref:uncharacterized protein LOC126263589 n=1 Tax=Schistocerca nitens TaxID=7011 RepID=UPI002119AD7B|nr:uncharacterized protein LOC126263589 [Schistocerca nitens]
MAVFTRTLPYVAEKYIAGRTSPGGSRLPSLAAFARARLSAPSNWLRQETLRLVFPGKQRPQSTAPLTSKPYINPAAAANDSSHREVQYAVFQLLVDDSPHHSSLPGCSAEILFHQGAPAPPTAPGSCKLAAAASARGGSQKPGLPQPAASTAPTAAVCACRPRTLFTTVNKEAVRSLHRRLRLSAALAGQVASETAGRQQCAALVVFACLCPPPATLSERPFASGAVRAQDAKQAGSGGPRVSTAAAAAAAAAAALRVTAGPVRTQGQPPPAHRLPAAPEGLAPPSPRCRMCPTMKAAALFERDGG